jgi:hypothetical protein
VTEYVLGGFEPFHQIGPWDGTAGGRRAENNSHAHTAVKEGGAAQSSSTPGTNPRLVALVQERRRKREVHKQPAPSGGRTSPPVGGSVGEKAVGGRSEDFTRVFQKTFLEIFLVK